MEKRSFTYRDIHKSVRTLAEQIKNSHLKPELMIAIGGGGFIPARILRTYLEIPIYAVNIVLYEGKETGETGPQVTQWLDRPEELLENRRILIVDEVDDTGTTLAYIVDLIAKYKPSEIGLAVIHKKKKEKKVQLPDMVDDYFAAEELGDEWIIYPWDITDIDKSEV